MAEESGQERTEEATSRHRSEARKRGTVAKSVDLSHSLAMLALLMVMPAALSSTSSGLIHEFKRSLADLPMQITMASLTQRGMAVLSPVIPGFIMLAGTSVGVAVFSTVAQVGLVLSPEALSPSFSKLNPLAGFKRLLSASGAFEVFKSTLKMCVFGYMVYLAIAGHWPEVSRLTVLTPAASLSAIGNILKDVAMRVALLWLALSLLDYFFQRKQIDKQLRMTKEQVRREMKDQESSPEMKAARMRRRRQLGKGSLREALRLADVVVTNPTHFAVAIQYDPQKHHAPLVVAKGQDLVAANIRGFAKELQIPLVPNPRLARALYKQCEVGDYVPRDLFQAVAEVLAYVYKTLKRVRS